MFEKCILHAPSGQRICHKWRTGWYNRSRPDQVDNCLIGCVCVCVFVCGDQGEKRQRKEVSDRIEMTTDWPVCVHACVICVCVCVCVCVTLVNFYKTTLWNIPDN
jgi:hypothetical protein